MKFRKLLRENLRRFTDWNPGFSPKSSGFTIAGSALACDTKENPLVDEVLEERDIKCRYYDRETHLGMFCSLGKDLRKLVEAPEIRVATLRDPVQHVAPAERQEEEEEEQEEEGGFADGVAEVLEVGLDILDPF